MKTMNKCNCKLKEKKLKKFKPSFPIPRGRILKQYVFKHNLLPDNPKTRKILMKYFEGKDLDKYQIEYDKEKE